MIYPAIPRWFVRVWGTSHKTPVYGIRGVPLGAYIIYSLNTYQRISLVPFKILKLHTTNMLVRKKVSDSITITDLHAETPLIPSRIISSHFKAHIFKESYLL